MRLDTTLLNNTAGTFSFQNLFTAGPNRVGGYDYASFLLGAATTGSVDFNRGGGVYSLLYGGGYVQDDWRVSSRFTLNYGLRFEHESGLRERTTTSRSDSIRPPPVPGCRRSRRRPDVMATPALRSRAD